MVKASDTEARQEAASPPSAPVAYVATPAEVRAGLRAMIRYVTGEDPEELAVTFKLSDGRTSSLAIAVARTALDQLVGEPRELAYRILAALTAKGVGRPVTAANLAFEMSSADETMNPKSSTWTAAAKALTQDGVVASDHNGYRLLKKPST